VALDAGVALGSGDDRASGWKVQHAVKITRATISTPLIQALTRPSQIGYVFA